MMKDHLSPELCCCVSDALERSTLLIAELERRQHYALALLRPTVSTARANNTGILSLLNFNSARDTTARSTSSIPTSRSAPKSPRFVFPCTELWTLPALEALPSSGELDTPGSPGSPSGHRALHKFYPEDPTEIFGSRSRSRSAELENTPPPSERNTPSDLSPTALSNQQRFAAAPERTYTFGASTRGGPSRSASRSRSFLITGDPGESGRGILRAASRSRSFLTGPDVSTATARTERPAVGEGGLAGTSPGFRFLPSRSHSGIPASHSSGIPSNNTQRLLPSRSASGIPSCSDESTKSGFTGPSIGPSGNLTSDSNSGETIRKPGRQRMGKGKLGKMMTMTSLQSEDNVSKGTELSAFYGTYARAKPRRSKYLLTRNTWKEWSRERIQHFLSWPPFDFAMGVVILTNIAMVGLEIDLNRHAGAPSASTVSANLTIAALEHMFLVIYCVELLLRLIADGRKVFGNRLTVMDMVLVAVGVSCSWIIEPLFLQGENSSAVFSSIQEKVLMLRTLRLLRLVRALRLLIQFKTLWRLVHGLTNSLDILCSTLVMLALLLYLLACVGLEIIAHDSSLLANDDASQIIAMYFDGLADTMLTLVRFVTLDNLVDIFAPLIRIQPWLSIFYLIALLVVPIALMNIVTALLVEQAIQSARMDAETEGRVRRAKIKALNPVIREFFRTLDRDNSGTIVREEVLQVLQGGADIPLVLSDLFKLESMGQLFEILDTDDSGEIDEEEFVNGVMQLAMTEVPIEARQTLKYLRSLRRKVDVVEKYLSQWDEKVGSQSEFSSSPHGKIVEAEAESCLAGGSYGGPERVSKVVEAEAESCLACGGAGCGLCDPSTRRARTNSQLTATTAATFT